MDRGFARDLHKISSDRRSGAAELALEAASAFDDWLKRNPAPRRSDFVYVIRAIANAQPSMAPLWNLANGLGLAWETSQALPRLSRVARAYTKKLLGSRARIAEHFAHFVRPPAIPEIITYSYSSTVAAALVRSRRYICDVRCSESRPGEEGRRMAAELARAGIPISYGIDASLFSQPLGGKIIVLGADAVLPGRIVAKTGCEALLKLAAPAKSQVFILADTSKFWPQPKSCQLSEWTWGTEGELWHDPPRGIAIQNLLLESSPLPPRCRIWFVTELGSMTPLRVRRYLSRMKLSALLHSQSD
jgi:translation initiation factor 2B subunit (eIF-2B alpha/beta/delta family)